MIKRSKSMARIACLVSAVFVSTLPAYATTAIDPEGDFLATYTGPQDPGLDVLSADVTYNGTNFLLSAFLAGSPLTNGATYVWGANRGAGTARFAASDPGRNGVLFDSVIALTYDSTTNTWGGVVNLLNGVVTPLMSGSVLVESTNITVLLPGSLLPSTGFAPGQYGFNLWPRGAGIAGFTGISDFAPNNATIAAAAAIPEPAAWGMMILGFGVTGFAARRRKRSVRVLA